MACLHSRDLFLSLALLLVSCTGLGSDNLKYGRPDDGVRVIDREGYALGYKAA